jgi:hypothetical protein
MTRSTRRSDKTKARRLTDAEAMVRRLAVLIRNRLPDDATSLKIADQAIRMVGPGRILREEKLS